MTADSDQTPTTNERGLIKVKTDLFRRIAVGATAIGVSAATLFSGAPPAHAVEPNGTIPITSAGSDTTQILMDNLSFDLNHYTDHTTNSGFPVSGVNCGNPSGSCPTADAENVPAFTKTPFTSQGYPGGANDCTANITWTQDPAAPTSNTALATGEEGVAPFGSSAGKNYLKQEETGTGPSGNGQNGNKTTVATGTDFSCVSVARASSGPGSGSAHFEYYAYALDGVSWATTSTHAPPALSLAQIQAIYTTCSITDWKQVGGTPGQIVRYFPQNGSGTQSFFKTNFLAGAATPGNTGSCNPSNAPPTGSSFSPSPVHLIEENQINGKGQPGGNDAFGVASADLDNAILVYSGGKLGFQSFNHSNPTINLSCTQGVCARFGAIIPSGTNPPDPSTAKSLLNWNGSDQAYELNSTLVTDANEAFTNGNTVPPSGIPGSRYLYNVLDQSTGTSYSAAKQMYGFTNVSGGAMSPVCNNSASPPSGTFQAVESQVFFDILSQGFLPLSHATQSNNSNIAGSACRFFSATG